MRDIAPITSSKNSVPLTRVSTSKALRLPDRYSLTCAAASASASVSPSSMAGRFWHGR
ncbi:MAG: hypothetical protein Q4Q62_02870 [Thermoplasmata archaeon]|nr:hypothetical protein [Thermoplasmata archaeon]